MPAFSTHYLFAKEMMDYLEETADFKINEDAVLFGTQGPDIFFFHRIMPWMAGRSLMKYGSILHRTKPQFLFENMREYCTVSNNPEIAKSYVYGFMLHYVLDKNCHPYVYSLQNRITEHNKFANPHTVHNIIEYALDAYLLNKRFGIQNPTQFDKSRTISIDSKVIEEIGKLLEYVVPKTIHKKITAKQAEQAIKDTKDIQKLMFDPNGHKQKITRILDIIIAPFSHNYKFSAMIIPKDLEKTKKYANIDNAKWKSPYSNHCRYESFENLFDCSIAEAQQMIKDFQSGKNCRDITKNKSFLTGVEVK